MPKKKKEAAISDANILIDYASVDEDLIREIVIYWEKVFVPDVILYEVRDLSTERAMELGLTIIQTPLVNLPERPKLSFQDRTCLYFVIAEKWVCIANDVPLRKESVSQLINTLLLSSINTFYIEIFQKRYTILENRIYYNGEVIYGSYSIQTNGVSFFLFFQRRKKNAYSCAF